MDKIFFTVNGEHYSLSGSDVPISTTLNDYLRNVLQLHGTKAMCGEGGCGACVVSVAQTHPVSKERRVFAVNSCLVHILSCHQWDITTIEGVGNRKDGYHSIQKRLADFNGTQCGYCSPGWVMNMYSLYESSKKNLTMQQIEKSFGGNMCRCTGYRPILDAFKSFAIDADPALKDKVKDIEDLSETKCVKGCCYRKCSTSCDEWCVIYDQPESKIEIEFSEDGSKSRWYKAYKVEDVFKILAKEGTTSYTLVAGNTGKGVYPSRKEPRIQVDISSIESLKDTLIEVNLVLGAGMSLTDFMMQCQKWSDTNHDFKYLEEFYKHLDLVAHVPVRNIGTIGGNLAMKNQHPDFPSDIFLLLETVQATVSILYNTLEKKDLFMQDFLKEDLGGKLILNVKLPPLSASCHVRTYKIMPRAQNAHAIVNAGFLFKLSSSNKVEMATITFGNISSRLIHAIDTENILKGLDLFSEETLHKALTKLSSELVPVGYPAEPSPLCRKTLALGLFYKAVLSICPNVNPRYKSGGSLLERGVSRGTQSFDTDKTLWPFNQAIPKLEALTQCSGEAKYACDVILHSREVHMAFVLSTICTGEIERFDESEALKLPGVVAFFTSKDIPGKNTFTPSSVPWQESEEEILASKKISYYGQPVALVAAVTQNLALRAAELVKVIYKKSNEKPVLCIQDAFVAPDKDRRVREDISIKAEDKGEDIKHVITGTFSMGSQYHYTMETQCCSVSNTEDGVSVRSSTQWMDLVHVAVAEMLALPENKVDVSVPRVGGAYGGKASRSALVACACALVSYKLNRSATLVMPLVDNMLAIGKRQPCYCQYEVGVNSEGVIQYANLKYYSDCGYSFNDSSGAEVAGTLTNLYDVDKWNIKGYSVLTDTASNTWCRAPATTEGTAILEHIMEHIAFVTKNDPVNVRILNLYAIHLTMKDIITAFKNDCNFDERKAAIAKFNTDNAWRKKSLKLSIMSYPIEYSWNFPVTISVYHADGTVAISHGGIEMGQGINTKVAQVCAYTLKIPLDKVSVKGSDNFVSPNAMASNGSISSESVAHATVKACNDLLARFEDVKKDLKEPTWQDIVKAAYEKGINLQASYMTSPLDYLEGYNVYGACACEVELDVLCGAHVVTRVDILEDTGVSISPDIDVGQIEGAFVMGLGLWTSEHLVYDKDTGRLLTDRTWTYKPCGARDIPADFRISFRRNSVNRAGVLSSKATGEPALTLAVGVTHALHETIEEARKEFGYTDAEWIHVDTPYNTENILKAIAPKAESYKLK